MSKPEWGNKCLCANCGARYYDMRKKQPSCPICNTVFDPEAQLKSRRAKTSADDGRSNRNPIVDEVPLIIGDDDAPELDGADVLDENDVEEVIDVGNEES